MLFDSITAPSAAKATDFGCHDSGLLTWILSGGARGGVPSASAFHVCSSLFSPIIQQNEFMNCNEFLYAVHADVAPANPSMCVKEIKRLDRVQLEDLRLGMSRI